MTRWLVLGLLLLPALGRPPAAVAQAARKTWAERLGWPPGKRVLLLHADDVGMCYEANASAQRALSGGEYRSAACMVPCPWFDEMAAWCAEHPGHDVGLHLTLTSEWRHYRWGPVAPRDRVRGLLDPLGYLHRDVAGVAKSATADEVAAEIKAQLARARRLGMKPSHVDTHMGTLYARPDYTKVYLELAVAEQIPAMAIEMTPHTIAKFRGQGYAFSDEMLKLIADYPLPKLDDFHAVAPAKTYEEKRRALLEQVRALPPGLHEVIFHPSVETEGLKRITNSWQQRVWEDRLMADPEVRQFWKEQGIVITDWTEVLARSRRQGP
jgi:predicted glycoside hydrolase/deacetylase ChbG (UPF0249 family)